MVVDGQILRLGQDGRHQLFHGGSGQAHRVDGNALLTAALELRRLESVIEHTCQCRRIGFHADAAGNRPTLGVAQSLVRKVDGLIVLFHGVDGGSFRLPGIVPEAFLYGQASQIRAHGHLGTQRIGSAQVGPGLHQLNQLVRVDLRCFGGAEENLGIHRAGQGDVFRGKNFCRGRQGEGGLHRVRQVAGTGETEAGQGPVLGHHIHRQPSGLGQPILHTGHQELRDLHGLFPVQGHGIHPVYGLHLSRLTQACQQGHQLAVVRRCRVQLEGSAVFQVNHPVAVIKAPVIFLNDADLLGARVKRRHVGGKVRILIFDLSLDGQPHMPLILIHIGLENVVDLHLLTQILHGLFDKEEGNGHQHQCHKEQDAGNDLPLGAPLSGLLPGGSCLRGALFPGALDADGTQGQHRQNHETRRCDQQLISAGGHGNRHRQLHLGAGSLKAQVGAHGLGTDARPAAALHEIQVAIFLAGQETDGVAFQAVRGNGDRPLLL